MGSGHAGVRQLLVVRPEIIKLDRSLVAGCDSDPGKRAMIESLTVLARGTGAAVCAERVEDLAQLENLAALGVVLAQGFALGAPAAGWTALTEPILVASGPAGGGMPPARRQAPDGAEDDERSLVWPATPFVAASRELAGCEDED